MVARALFKKSTTIAMSLFQKQKRALGFFSLQKRHSNNSDYCNNDPLFSKEALLWLGLFFKKPYCCWVLFQKEVNIDWCFFQKEPIFARCHIIDRPFSKRDLSYERCPPSRCVLRRYINENQV